MYLRVSTSALRDWSNDGLVPCEQRPRRYDQRTLDTEEVRALSARYHTTYGQRTPDDGRLTIRQAAALLGVHEHYIRDFLISPGKLTPERGGARGNTLLFSQHDVAAVPAVWRERHASTLLSIGEAAERLAITVPRLRHLTARGVIPSLVTDGGTRRYRCDDLLAAAGAA